MSDWLAPVRGNQPISAELTIPGSKSVTNRALVLAALASTPSTLIRPLHSRDTELMIQGLRSLGIDISIIPKPNNESATIEVNPKNLYGPAAIEIFGINFDCCRFIIGFRNN